VKITPSLKLLGESTRYKMLASQLAYDALFGPVEAREEKQRLAHDHAIRAETYAAAARLISNGPLTTDNRQPTKPK